MNSILADMLATGRVQTPAGSELPLHSHLPQLEGEILHAWVVALKPARLLEIGLAYGVSALFICDALGPQASVSYHIVDAFQQRDWHGCGVFNLNRAGYEGRYTLHEEPSELCLPGLLAQGYRFEFAFIDGFHTFDHALVDFFYINRMLEVGGVVVFDDIQLPAIQKLLAYISTYACYKPLLLPEQFRHHRVIRVRQMMGTPPVRIAGFIKTAPDERPWNWYHDF
ncbi:MAG: hypothetical protein Kow0031_20230 [Anaerolineae bacterium]